VTGRTRGLVARRHGADHISESGSVAVFALLICLAFTALLGLVAEGGQVLSAREAAMAAAEQGARAGAARLSAATLHGGGIIDPPAACVKTAEAMLAGLGHPGTASARGSRVTATVTPTRISTPLLAIVGFPTMTITASASAEAVRA
jgi:hypothetical protein